MIGGDSSGQWIFLIGNPARQHAATSGTNLRVLWRQRSVLAEFLCQHFTGLAQCRAGRRSILLSGLQFFSRRFSGSLIGLLTGIRDANFSRRDGGIRRDQTGCCRGDGGLAFVVTGGVNQSLHSRLGLQVFGQ